MTVALDGRVIHEIVKIRRSESITKQPKMQPTNRQKDAGERSLRHGRKTKNKRYFFAVVAVDAACLSVSAPG